MGLGQGPGTAVVGLVMKWVESLGTQWLSCIWAKSSGLWFSGAD